MTEIIGTRQSPFDNDFLEEDSLKVLVCGGRRYGWKPKSPTGWEIDKLQIEYLEKELNKLPKENLTIISGAASGADTWAIQWAAKNNVKREEYPADWKTFGMRAGLERNIKMLLEGRPNFVIAFPGGSGTAHMVKIAKRAGIKVKLFAGASL